MSSSLAPFGLKPIFHPSGQIRANERKSGIASGYATAIYKGSPVALNTSGVYIIAAGGSSFVGAFAGCAYTTSSGQRVVSSQWTASATYASDMVAYAYEDPDIVYAIQADGAVPQTGVGAHMDFSGDSGYAIGDGNTTTGLSTAAGESTLIAAASQGMLRVLGLHEVPGNAWNDTYTQVQVQVARHQFVANIVGI
jgi:hypothetical protein